VLAEYFSDPVTFKVPRETQNVVDERRSYNATKGQGLMELNGSWVLPPPVFAKGVSMQIETEWCSLIRLWLTSYTP